MNLYQAFKTDPKLESGSGVSVDMGTAKFLIHRAGGTNKAFIDLLNARRKPVQRQIDMGTLDDEVAKKMLAEVYSMTVIKGWDGVTNEAGEPLDFSVANCTKLLLDLPDLFTTLQTEAQRMANFQAAAVEVTTAALKND